MEGLITLSRWLDMPSRFIGRWLRWLAVLLVLLQFVVVGMRYLFASTSTMLQESVLYTNATLFMATAGYAYLVNAHVRVDIAYFGASPRRRALIDLLGIVFGVLPLCGVMVWFGWPYVRASWANLEGPLFFGGIPAVYLLKSLILAFPILILLQSLALAIRAAAVLGGRELPVFAEQDPGRLP